MAKLAIEFVNRQYGQRDEKVCDMSAKLGGLRIR